MRKMLSIGAGVAMAAGALLTTAVPAAADPSANDWASLRQCESSGNYATNTGNGYYGAYQFDLGTWESVGGSGLPSAASPAEQDFRALYLYRMRGFSPWICASLAGLTDDADARSGKVPTQAEAAAIGHGTGSFTAPDTSACNVGGSTAPAWGGVDFVQGQTYRDMICFQRQLGHLGYGLQGSGYFGSNTLAALHKFESTKGLPTTSAVNERTWVAAWGRSGGEKAGVKPTPAPVKTTPKPTPVKTTPKPAPVKTTPKPAPVKVTPKPVLSTPTWPGLTAAACHIGARKAPAWPGDYWTTGDMNRNLACWQAQMNDRGYQELHGNGYYGANTLAAAKDIQNRNHLGGTGVIGPNTWKAAWEGLAK